ncbi:DUF916 and DUF3324 domain-containing protein [Enterococcus sp. BWM-S5]|uniref:DUF916 and DUF3324 domain-containing protein n=1 Tax=Enterococcus larvae TaxID=2794352 RepID=A0ABS4CDZ7_9ENTE|nr:DUF916 and DUF3324 domain-containing protein [Enterococcus larvae]MBP1044672.1 DUF916 and DUF3324 domain-containing protein [Enterococcus larvae]
MERRLHPIVVFTFLTMVFVSFFSTEGAVFADESGDVSGATGFTYSINFPDNQMEEDIGYFKLKMSQGQEQTIQISLSNPSTEIVEINVSLNGAKTNQNGVIEYGDSDIENDPSLKFDFTDIVTGPDSITLEPGETKHLAMKIQMPDTGIDGVIAGGIQLMRANQDEQASDEGGSRIINQYAYVVGVLLQESEDLPEADLALNSVYADQDNHRNAIFVDFSNVIASYLNDMTVEVQINKKGNNSVLYERKQTAMRMAPNTFLKFPISMNGERMAAGEYTAAILVTSGNRKWEWSEDFEITNEEADKFNERDVGLVQEKGLDWKLIAIIVVSVLAVIGIIFFIILMIKKNRQRADAHRRKRNRKKKD